MVTNNLNIPHHTAVTVHLGPQHSGLEVTVAFSWIIGWKTDIHGGDADVLFCDRQTPILMPTIGTV